MGDLYYFQYKGNRTTFEYYEKVLEYCQKSLEYYQESLALKEQFFSKADVSIADSYINIGKVYYYKGNKNVAEKYFDDALDIYVTEFGEDSLEVADVCCSIGSSSSIVSKIIDIVLGSIILMPDIIVSFDNISISSSIISVIIIKIIFGIIFIILFPIFSFKFVYDIKLKYYFEALEIKEKILGTEHEDTKQIYLNIADIYKELWNTKKANEYSQKADGEN